MKRNSPRSRRKRPTATIDLKAKEVKKASSEKDEETKDKKKAAPDAAKDSSSATRGTSRSGSSSAAKSSSAGSDKVSGKTAPQKTAKADSKSDDKSASRKAETAKAQPARNTRNIRRSDNGSPRPNASSATTHKALPPQKSGGGFLSHMLASVIGAGLGIFGLSYANNHHMLPPALQLSGDNKKLERRLNVLATKLNMVERTTSADNPDGMAARIASLSSRVQEIQNSLGGGKEGHPGLADKVNKLQKTFHDLEQAARKGKGGRLAGLTTVSKQLKKSHKQALALENELIKVREEQNDFRQDLAELRSKQADFIATSAKISDELARLKNSTAKIVAKASQPPDVSAQINPVMTSLAALTSKIDGVISREAQSRAEGRNIALALSLGELKRAVNEGVPYENELSRITPHAPPGLDLSVLSQYASSGLVTLKKLQAEFRTASNKAMAAEQVPASGSLVDQLVNSAKNMVQIRPTGFVKGDSTGAVIARMEYRLNRGDLTGTLKESKALSGKAAKTMAPWLRQAQARADGDRVLRTLEDKIRNALAGAASGKG